MSTELTLLQRTFMKAGYLLVDMQTTERAIKLCAKVALPKIEEILDPIEDRLGNLAYDKQTLGPMLVTLRRRAVFQKDFEAILTRFLENRNLFVHGLEQIPGVGLRSEAELREFGKFLLLLLRDSRTVRSVFVGIVHSWAIQSGYNITEEEASGIAIPPSLEKPIIRRLL